MRSMMAMLAVVPMTAAAQNLLVNGDLELGTGGNSADGWTLQEPSLDANGVSANSAEFIGFANNTAGGARGLWFRSFEGGLGGDEPSTVDAILFQNVAGTAGVNYTLSAFFRFETFYTADNTFLTLAFLNSNGQVIGASTLDVQTVLQNNTGWQEFSVSGVAAAGTTTVQARVTFNNGRLATGNPQSAFVDDLSLVPAPGAAAMLGVAGLMAGRRRR